jgi:hypothetical protein
MPSNLIKYPSDALRALAAAAALVFGMALIANTARAQAPVDPTKRVFASLSPATRLAYAGGLMRLQGSVSMANLTSRLPQSDGDVLRQGLALRGDPAEIYWAKVLRAAVQLQRVDKNVAETLWWNPALDAGVALSWRRAGEHWRLLAAAPALGETVRGETPRFNGQPGWSNDAGGLQALGHALATVAAATRRAVAAGNLRMLFARPITAAQVLSRAALVDGALKWRAGSAGYQQYYFAKRLLVEASAAPAANVASASQNALAALLASYSQDERGMFAPRLLIENGTQTTILWNSTGATHEALLLHYASAASPASASATSYLPSAVVAVGLVPSRGEQP